MTVTAYCTACLATKVREDPLLFFKWNDTGKMPPVAMHA